jgi:HlyD family secretion protein
VEANAGYSRTIDGPRQADVDAAQAVLNAAYANYEKVKTGPLPEDYADLEAALHNAEAVLKQAQDAYNVANGRNPAGIGGEPAALQLEQATNAYNAARANYDRTTKAPDNAQLSAALQQIESAKANLAKLQQPPRQYDLDQAAAQRQQAQIQVDQARRHLEQAALRAPKAGLISDVSIKEGELAGTQPIITLVDLSRLHIDITVDEVDVAKIKPGQEVMITLDALPDATIKGTIDRIAPASSTVGGVVSYSVRVLLGPTNTVLKAGMTANTSVVLERRENVLLAPNWAVRRDKKTGQSFITTQVDARTNKEVEVATGMRNETFSEITSGVSEGQVILAPQTSSLASQ